MASPRQRGRRWSVSSAFRSGRGLLALSRSGAGPGYALFAVFTGAGLTFDVVLDHLYPDAVTAAQALAELPGDLASRAGTMALDDPLAIYYSSLVSPGGGDGPVAPVKAVAQNAAVPVAGAR